MVKEFKEFALRGNMLDMAVGIILSAAFGKSVSSFVDDLLMPPLSLLLGRVHFASLFLNLSGQPFATPAEAGFTPMQAVQAATRNPAEFLGQLDPLGTVERGRIADLVLLDANPLEGIRNTKRGCPPRRRWRRG